VREQPVDVGIKELRDNLSRYVAQARDGEEIWITDRGKRVARLTSVPASNYEELVRQRIIRPPLEPKTPRTMDDLIRLPGNPTLSDIVLEQRGR
jgi:prevent-host-death family protein